VSDIHKRQTEQCHEYESLHRVVQVYVQQRRDANHQGRMQEGFETFECQYEDRDGKCL
jgi:hypothetical protein